MAAQQAPIFPEGMSPDRLDANMHALVKNLQDFARVNRERAVRVWLEQARVGYTGLDGYYTVVARGVGYVVIAFKDGRPERVLSAPVPLA